MFCAKIFEMRLEQPKKNFHRVARIGNLKTMFIARLVGKSESERQFPGDQIKRAETKRQLFEKASQDKKERLRRFDFVLEFHQFGEDFRRPNEPQQARRFPIRFFPEQDSFRSE